MKRDNIEFMRGGLEALRRDDRQALLATLDPGVVGPGLEDEWLCSGADEVVGVFTTQRDEAREVDALELIGAEHHGILHARGGGALASELQDGIYNVFAIENGHIARIGDYAAASRHSGPRESSDRPRRVTECGVGLRLQASGTSSALSAGRTTCARLWARRHLQPDTYRAVNRCPARPRRQGCPACSTRMNGEGRPLCTPAQEPGVQTDAAAHGARESGNRFEVALQNAKATLVSFGAPGHGIAALRRRRLVAGSPRILTRDDLAAHLAGELQPPR